MTSFWGVVKRAGKIAAGLAALGIILIVALLVSLRIEHGFETTLPAPSGPYAVGRAMYYWKAAASGGSAGAAAAGQREVIAWIWYPATANAAAPRAEYLPGPWSAALAAREGFVMNKLFTRDVTRVRVHSVADADVSSERKKWPVVILRAGGAALTTDFTTLGEDLASHGYVVAGFDAPYRTFVMVMPNGRVIARPPQNDPENLPGDQADQVIERLLPMWVEDTKFVVDELEALNSADSSGRFQGRLDLEKLGMFGHSFGGATALEFCHEDARCKAGIDMDGAPYGSVVKEGLRQPFFFLVSDHRRDLRDPANRQIQANMNSIYDGLPNGRLFIALRGASHFSFSDEIVVKSHILIGLLHAAGFGSLDGRRGLGITADYVHTFFGVYLNGEAAEKLDAISGKYPEAEIQRR